MEFASTFSEKTASNWKDILMRNYLMILSPNFGPTNKFAVKGKIHLAASNRYVDNGD